MKRMSILTGIVAAGVLAWTVIGFGLLRGNISGLVIGASSLPSSSNSLQYGGHTYQRFETPGLTWGVARTRCQQIGGDLASLNTQAEQDAIYGGLVSGYSGGLWIGLTDVLTEGVFRWVDGTAAAYTKWSTSPIVQPDNAGPWANEDCGDINHPGLNGAGTWNDYGCDATDVSGYICEIGGQASSAAAQLSVPACSDGVDNDADGYADSLDPGCQGGGTAEAGDACVKPKVLVYSLQPVGSSPNYESQNATSFNAISGLGFTPAFSNRQSQPTITSSFLSSYDVVWFFNGCGGATGIPTSAELTAIRDFYLNGGNLIMTVDDANGDASAIGDCYSRVNAISQNLGVSFNGSLSDPNGPPYCRNATAAHVIATGVTQMQRYSATNMTLGSSVSWGQTKPVTAVTIQSDGKAAIALTPRESGHGAVVFQSEYGNSDSCGGQFDKNMFAYMGFKPNCVQATAPASSAASVPKSSAATFAFGNIGSTASIAAQAPASSAATVAGPSVCTTICGDGVVIAPEQCDDGNAVDTDACSNTCTFKSSSSSSRSSSSTSSVRTCLPGTICPTGDLCPANGICPTASSSSSSHSTNCVPGTICPTGDICPQNGVCPVGSSSSSSRSANCIPGTLCPTGDICPQNGMCPTNCIPGTLCPTGDVCPANGVCPLQCIPGTICANGMTCPQNGLCPTSCTPGTMCANGGICNDQGMCPNGCTPGTMCPTGDLCPENGICPTNCVPGTLCPTGDLCPASGVCPTDCIPGTMCASGALCPANGICPQQCTPGTLCANGMVCPDDGFCPQECIPGTLCANGAQCTVNGLCPAVSSSSSANNLTCDINADCASNLCIGGFCACTSSAQCAGNACVGGFCANMALGANLTSFASCSGDNECPDGMLCIAGSCASDTAACGNGRLDAGEVCDDGNGSNDDGCTTSCLLGENAACASPRQCQSLVCTDGVCGRCSDNSQCPDDMRCADGMCVPVDPLDPDGDGIVVLADGVRIPVAIYSQLGASVSPQNLTFAQYQRLLQQHAASHAPIGSTGPESVAVVAAGASAGYAWMKMRKMKKGAR